LLTPRALDRCVNEDDWGLFDFQIPIVRQTGFESDIDDLITRFIPPHKAPQDKQVAPVDCVVNPSRLHHGADHLFGREAELVALDEAWNNTATHLVTIVAFGGVLVQFRDSDIKEGAVVVTAMPPDVRRWLCPAVSGLFEFWGYAPGRSPIHRNDF
jgi:hypothetical protein